MYAAMNIMSDAFCDAMKPFDCHLAFYPGLTVRPASYHIKFTKAPILICQGDVDDYTPTSLALETAGYKNECDANVSIVRFLNSHHSFDRVDVNVLYYPDVRACGGIWTVDIHEDGRMHLPVIAYDDAETGLDRLGAANAGGCAPRGR